MNEGAEPMDPILTRRSIRSYSNEPVQQEDLDHLLRAAGAAPCANGRRSWHFVVIDQRQLLDAIPSFHPYSKMVLQAPLAILVTADPKVEPNEGYWVQNCSAATQNILIAATQKGLGSVWLGIYPRKERMEGMRKLSGIPEEMVPFSLVVVGHPNEKKPPYKEIDRSRVHHNTW